MQEFDEFGRDSAIFEERLVKDTRPAMGRIFGVEASI
jgi:hypothetical protein